MDVKHPLPGAGSTAVVVEKGAIRAVTHILMNTAKRMLKRKVKSQEDRKAGLEIIVALEYLNGVPGERNSRSPYFEACMEGLHGQAVAAMSSVDVDQLIGQLKKHIGYNEKSEEWVKTRRSVSLED